MTLIEGLWVFSTISTNIATVIMMFAYRSMGRDISKIHMYLFWMNIKITGRSHGGVQKLAEDTEVGE